MPDISYSLRFRSIGLVCAFLAVWLGVADIAAQNTGVYVGGHIRRKRPATITKLKNSGFTYVILFNINVEPDGTLTTDGETVCRDGVYVFGDTQPFYADDVKALKTWPTAIQRIEICIGGWGNESYARIRDLVGSEGCGENSILYRNFQALKNAIPEIDAVNNDDEHGYDVASALAFHKMMWQLGYHTTLAPYMRKSYWSGLASQLNAECPGACDRVLIQCYDGGSGNNPSDWHLDGITLHAGRTNYQTDMDTSVEQMRAWRDNNGVEGGFVWVYNDETWNLNEWASAMNRVFPAHEVESPAAVFYTENNFGGYEVLLPEGEFCTGQLATYGLSDKAIASFKLSPGYSLEVFSSSDLSGTGRTYTENELARMGAWAHRISSLRIISSEEVAVTDIETVMAGTVDYFDLQGRALSVPPVRGIYLVRANGVTTKVLVR